LATKPAWQSSTLYDFGPPAEIEKDCHSIESEEMGVAFLGSIPLDPVMADTGDSGRAFVQHFPDSPAAEIIQKIAELLLTSDKRMAPNDLRPSTGGKLPNLTPLRRTSTFWSGAVGNRVATAALFTNLVNVKI